MTYVPAAQKVTRSGPNGPVVLTARVWALLEDAYKAAGIPVSDLVVTQGSWHHGSQSGSTHDGGGAFDLRVWNIPAHLHEALVVELRKRDVCAWKRDAAHGGFSPHIHGIVRDEAALSSGAAWQVRDYDNGGNGLQGASAGKDYHPRPAQHPFHYAPPPPPWGGKNIGWFSLQRAQIKAAQKVLGVRQTGTYLPLLDGAFRNAIGVWQAKHPKAYEDDGKKPGVIGLHLYESLMVYYK